MRVLLLALLLLPLAAAQGHDHAMGSGYAVATDLGPSGLAHVGSPVHFEFIAFGDDSVPDFHQDLPFRITLDNVTLYEASVLSGHDYDGLHGFDIVFPRPGTWRAAVLADGEEVAYRTGEVIDPPARAARVVVTPAAGGYTIDVEDDDGRINHSNVLVELIQDGRVRLRTTLHLHAGPASFDVSALGPTPTTLRATAFNAFPGAENRVTPATVTTGPFTPTTVQVVPTIPAAPPVPAAAKNAAVVVDAGDYTLVGTYDPYTVVGPETLQHLNVLVIDQATGMPVQHVDFEATLRGPLGPIFASSDFHEYDGILSLDTRQPVPGQYVLEATASRGEWSASIEMSYVVAPPVQANLVGPQIVRMQSDDFAAYTPAQVTWSVTNPAGLAFAHGEIDMQVLDAHGLVIVRDKLHTHGDGTFPFTMNFVDAGRYAFDLDPFPLDAQPTGPYYRDSIGTALAFAADVSGQGPAWPTTGDEAPAPPGETTPMPVALLLAGLVVALAARKR